MAQQQKTEMTAMDKRKLITEIKTELKPFITQLAELSVTKTTVAIKGQVRTLQGEVTKDIKMLSERLTREVLRTKDETIKLVNDVSARLDHENKMMIKTISRNKSDTDLKHNKSLEVEHDQRNNLLKHDDFFSVVAQTISVLLENLNIQMEAETADMLDRRMMSLFAVAKKGDLDKGDM